MNLAELETSLRLAVAQEYPLYATVVLIPSLRGIDSLVILKVSLPYALTLSPVFSSAKFVGAFRSI